MSIYDVVVEIGQIWVHEIFPHIKYEVVEIVADGSIYSSVYVDEYSDEILTRRHGLLGYCRDGKPYEWMTGWGLSKPGKPKRFSHVSQKSLRKKVREQMAGSLLAEKS